VFPDLLEPGKYFFHYTKWESAREFILPERRLRLSPYKDLADPLESRERLLGAGVSYSPGDPSMEIKISMAHADAATALNELKLNSKVLALTVDADWVMSVKNSDARYGMGWASASMWEHYAANHAGVCLVFNKERFSKVVLPQLQATSPTARAGSVHYWRPDREQPPYPPLLLDQGGNGEELAMAHLEKHFKEYFFTKLAVWEGEHEFRFVQPAREPGYTYVDYGDSLVGFVVGELFPRGLEPRAIELAKKLRIEVTKIIWDFNGPLPGSFPSPASEGR
jgi:hypothetical protein